jgi:hypothetical protein
VWLGTKFVAPHLPRIFYFSFLTSPLKTIPLFSFLILFAPSIVSAQSVDVDNLLKLKKKKAMRLSGGLTANGSFYDATDMYGRQWFTWQLGGNLNLSLYELIDIPVTLNLNNYGSQFSYPSLPNRFSLHPSYKWAKAHIGDVSMSFSPYTLSGHLFTGGGVELTPGKWNIMAMGGRLVRRVEYDPALPGVPPSYARWGAGGKVRYNGGRFFAGGSLFTAGDRAGEISFRADSLGIFPKSNIASSVEAGVNILPNLKLSAEYALSAMVRDTRQQAIADPSGQLLGRKADRSYYHAMKASIDYTFLSNTVGVGYERIDPQYETLGAYYFNNDYENVTLNYARPLFGGKASVALSGGVQRDDLDGTRQNTNTRLVGSANVAYSPTEKLNMALSASTFQGYRNIKSQFDYINQTAPYENLDTLSFTQLSQNVDFNISWNFLRSERASHSMTFFASYQEAADRQGGYILPGNLSRFMNGSANYTIDLTQINTSFNAGFNISNNYSNLANFLTFGPMAAASMRLFDKKLTTGVSFSWNRSIERGIPVADILNCRWNANMRLFKRHSLQASMMYQRQSRTTAAITKRTYTATAQIGYAYSF